MNKCRDQNQQFLESFIIVAFILEIRLEFEPLFDRPMSYKIDIIHC